MQIKVSLRTREAFNYRQQLRAILFKFDWRRTANVLIHLGSRRHAVGPWHGQVKRKPFQNISMKHVSRCADCFVSRTRFERVGEMTNHLMSRHFSPATLAIGVAM